MSRWILFVSVCRKQAKDDQISFPALREMLEGLRQEIGEMSLTTRSQRFLMITDGPAMARFVNEHKGQPLKRQVSTNLGGSLD
jgi:hypothetical protein